MFLEHEVEKVANSARQGTQGSIEEPYYVAGAQSLPGARGGFRLARAVSSMQRAELAWRKALAAQTLADVKAEAELHAPAIAGAARRTCGRD